MSPQVVTLYGAKTDVFETATLSPTSTTSGAVEVPAFWLMASTSCWLLPLGFSELTAMPYLAVKALMASP